MNVNNNFNFFFNWNHIKKIIFVFSTLFVSTVAINFACNKVVKNDVKSGKNLTTSSFSLSTEPLQIFDISLHRKNGTNKYGWNCNCARCFGMCWSGLADGSYTSASKNFNVAIQRISDSTALVYVFEKPDSIVIDDPFLYVDQDVPFNGQSGNFKILENKYPYSNISGDVKIIDSNVHYYGTTIVNYENF